MGHVSTCGAARYPDRAGTILLQDQVARQ